MRQAIRGHDLGHTDSLTHTYSHTNKPPTAGVQLVGHTSIIYRLLDITAILFLFFQGFERLAESIREQLEEDNKK